MARKARIETDILQPRHRGRPGGNPGLKEFQFKSKGDSPLVKTLGWRVTEEQFLAAKAIPDLGDRFREWLEIQLKSQQ